MVDQMQLIKRNKLPQRQPPVAKDKGKEKQIEIADDAIPQQKKNHPMLIFFIKKRNFQPCSAYLTSYACKKKRAKGRFDICLATS